MLLGIDYGTTRTVVAAVDRGNYPVVSFHTADGDTQDWYPSLIAARGDARLYGLDAACCQDDPDWALLRSFKRQLATLGPTARMHTGHRRRPRPGAAHGLPGAAAAGPRRRAPTCASPRRSPWRP